MQFFNEFLTSNERMILFSTECHFFGVNQTSILLVFSSDLFLKCLITILGTCEELWNV